MKLLFILLGAVSLVAAAPIRDSQALDDWDCNWACKLFISWPPSSASSATLSENEKEEFKIESARRRSTVNELHVNGRPGTFAERALRRAGTRLRRDMNAGVAERV
ncbi:hypothetical protein AUEXF2481DRAFT_30415 [Aureobasidium subglaciale EXF-2481]|uniref:Uncharacterized protein n=1 Tax=Aureobasidium subglaciale (strain EXF-2481) TaxID=1043005 RepID=A0A074YEE3_AURSE|nr:uncharacterized protein AUEXF2481DRAFT_30415 [Aureobasidium subglaciale EXF-2481]KEQ94439.1 hypothetical protein AUEXF2481DRAFT_30415 [Aureobasidium subglaciale EXF-2481]